MKISEKVYNLMMMCCRNQNKISRDQKLITKELEKLGVDIDLMRYHDSPVVSFIDYGYYTKKEIIEEDLDRYVNSSGGEQNGKA